MATMQVGKNSRPEWGFMSGALAERSQEFHFGDEEFDFLTRLAYERTGIVLNESKRSMVYARLTRRVRTLGFSSFSEYCDLLRSDQGDSEMGALVNAITTNLTHFFREAHHFTALCEQVKERGAHERIRVWSAGCSSGMEPYSMAMSLLAAVPGIANWDARILATDIDSGMLERARAGIYPEEEFGNIPPSYHRYIAMEGDKLTVGEEPRALIAFRQLNLLEDWPMRGKFDVIFCRNVVIYFDVPTKRRLFQRYVEQLRPGGLLCIGHSESVPSGVERLTLVGRTTYRRDL